MAGDTTHRVQQPEFDGQVSEYTRQGYRESVPMLHIEEFISSPHASLDGGETVDVRHPTTRLRIREEYAYNVMLALADYYGYDIEPR